MSSNFVDRTHNETIVAVHKINVFLAVHCKKNTKISGNIIKNGFSPDTFIPFKCYFSAKTRSASIPGLPQSTASRCGGVLPDLVGMG